MEKSNIKSSLRKTSTKKLETPAKNQKESAKKSKTKEIVDEQI